MTQLIFDHETIRPQYEANCFSGIPGLIRLALTGAPETRFSTALPSQLMQRYKQVVFFFVDGFGWRFFEQFADHPFLKHVGDHGHVKKATSQFPSTTAAHITTMSTGKVVGEHGVFEWQYYEPMLDAMIVPLLWSWSGEQMPELLRGSGIDPASILPTNTIFQTMQNDGVTSYAFLPAPYAHSTYSRAMTQGTTIVPYKTLPTALVSLGQLMAESESRTCYYFYFGDIDTVCHDYGPDSPQVASEIEAFLLLMERFFLRQIKGNQKDTLLIISADHGQTAVDPETTIYLNLLPEFEQLQPMLKRNRAGELLTPGGSARDVFLYVNDEMLAEAHTLLTALLIDRADVYKTSDLIEQGLFGSIHPSAIFLSRVGNLVILPKANQTVWWYEKDRFGQGFYGHHGGLSPDEMEIPLLLYPMA